jgi:hypothetical protein
MFSKSIRIALCLLVPLAAIVYSQPPSSNGGLLQSSRWDPDGSNYDRYVWDNFTLPSAQQITAIQWRGGYDPSKFGSGGPVIDFKVAIYASIPGGSEPDVVNPPLVDYQTGGKAGETPAGTFGDVAMYDYQYTLPTSFQAASGTTYWVQIEALQHGLPDWGITSGTGGDGKYFRKYHTGADVFQIIAGDAAFSLLGPAQPIGGLSATNDSPTMLGQATTFTATLNSGSGVSYTWDF